MFDSVTTIGLLLTLVMIFSFQGNTILEKPLHIVLIAVPLILQTFLIFAIAYIACRVLKLPYKIAAPAGMICGPFAVWCGWVCQVVTVLRSSLPQVR